MDIDQDGGPSVWSFHFSSQCLRMPDAMMQSVWHAAGMMATHRKWNYFSDEQQHLASVHQVFWVWDPWFYMVCVYVYRGPPPTLAVARFSHTGPSWADRVKSSQSLPVPSQSVNIPVEKPGELIFSIYSHLFSKPKISVLFVFMYTCTFILSKERCRGLGDRAAWAFYEAKGQGKPRSGPCKPKGRQRQGEPAHPALTPGKISGGEGARATHTPRAEPRDGKDLRHWGTDVNQPPFINYSGPRDRYEGSVTSECFCLVTVCS